jgi:hypothetical protein
LGGLEQNNFWDGSKTKTWPTGFNFTLWLFNIAMGNGPFIEVYKKW